MKIKTLEDYLEELAPLSLQEDYDNSGLLVGNSNKEIGKALITLDVTEEVLSEAIDNQCDLVISHHPLIFRGIKKLIGNSLTERLIVKAIKADIAIYAIHTNLDNSNWGVNAILGEKLGLKELKVLSAKSANLHKLVTFCPSEYAEKVRNAIFDAGAGHIGNYDCCSYNINGEGTFRALDGANPFVGEQEKLHFEKEVRIETIVPTQLINQVVFAMIKAHPYEEVAYDLYLLENKNQSTGSGMIGNLPAEIPITKFLNQVKNTLGSQFLKHSKLISRPVKSVAFCGGSGSFLIDLAYRSKADVFITSDLKYHNYFEHTREMTIVDAGHFETEQFTKELLYTVLNKKFPTFALQISSINTNPIFFL